MRIIDDKGMLFGNRINLIDYLAIVFILCCIPAFYYGFRILTKKPVEVTITNYYVKHRACPNCDNAVIIDTIEGEARGIPKGEPLPKFYEAICDVCENEVVLINRKSLHPVPPNWTLMLHKLLYEEKIKGRDAEPTQ